MADSFVYRLNRRQLLCWMGNQARRDGQRYRDFFHGVVSHLAAEAGCDSYLLLSPSGFYIGEGHQDAIRHAA